MLKSYASIYYLKLPPPAVTVRPLFSPNRYASNSFLETAHSVSIPAVTTLGYGEYTPSSGVSRVLVMIVSLLGIAQTALIIQVIQDKLKARVKQQQ